MQTKSGVGASFANNKGKVALIIGLAASLLVSGMIFFTHITEIDLLKSEIADKSKALSSRDQQILEDTLTITSQKQQIEEKSIELQSLTSQIVSLEDKIAVNELEIRAKTSKAEQLTETVNAQENEIQILKGQAARLQDEIRELELEIQEREDEIAILTEKVAETEAELEGFKRISINHYSVAVTQENVGIVLPIEVEIIPSGEGIVSIDVKNVQYETGFQEAVRRAVGVASDYSDVSVSDKDIIITVLNDFDGGLITIDGGSAGALITAMIAVGLTGQEIDSSVLITGSINSDGTVGSISGLQEKAEAAGDFGAKVLLVPEAQEFDDESISVIGVSDIDDVMRYLSS